MVTGDGDDHAFAGRRRSNARSARGVRTARTLQTSALAVKPRAESRSAPSAAAPVLLLADALAAGAIEAVLGAEFALTVTDDVERARALAATGGFVAILAAAPLAASFAEAVAIDPTRDASAIAAAVAAEIRDRRVDHDERVAALAYDEYIEHARYAMTRRYLMALLHRHRGSVTDAARSAGMVRESLHRLMRRHHVVAEDFRDHRAQ